MNQLHFGTWRISFFIKGRKKASAVYDRQFPSCKEADEWAKDIFDNSSIYDAYEIESPTPDDYYNTHSK